MRMAIKSKAWTRADLQRLPNDGNSYELVRGALLVSPAPRPGHEELRRLLAERLSEYCRSAGVGEVYSGNPAFVTPDSEVMPDIVIRRRVVPPPERWDDAPLPALVVEVVSDSSRRHDRITKRGFYLESGIPEYWIVDGDERTIAAVKQGMPDIVFRDVLMWAPSGADAEFRLDVREFFRDALGR